MNNTPDVSLEPKAPKDPVKKSQSFFILRNKDIAAMPLDDGSFAQFVFLTDGRLVSSAKLAGGIEDEEELNLLKTTEGLRKLVAQVGVSVETDEPDEEVKFCFHMYGNKDLYGSGTQIITNVRCDGSEKLIELDKVDWSDDDKEPGQFRFDFKKAGIIGKATVKFYLNDGFTAPVQEEEDPVDTSLKAYADMIDNSVVSYGNNARIKRALKKARAGEDVTVAFIGGSITQGAGAIPINTECYAYKTFKGFCGLAGKGTDENIHYVKAGVGGTPSELGMLRYETDVLYDGKVTPDIVVVEFAVNDAGDETGGRCYDSLVQMIYDGPGSPAVILLFAVFQDDFNLEERLSPVGFGYNLPMVSTKKCVTKQFYLKASEGRVVSKNQFFYDCFHPTNIGHTIMADGILKLFKDIDKAPEDEEIKTLKAIKPPIGAQFFNVKLLDKKHSPLKADISAGDFTHTDKQVQCVERNMDLTVSPEFPDNWMYKGGSNKPFTMDIDCKSLLIIYKDSADPNAATAKVYADGELKLTIDPKIIGWTHANPLIVFEETETKRHHIEVKMKEGFENGEFTICGFGVVE